METLLDSDVSELPAFDGSIGVSADPVFDIKASSSNDNKHNEKERRVALREKETKRRRVYRQRLKDERNVLLHEVDGLTMTLATMKQTILHRKITNDHTLANKSGDNRCNVDMWKTMANWELESLKRAQGEQKRLLAALSGKAKIIKNLHSVIRRELSQLIGVQPSDDALFQAYLREVDVNYTRMDDVFRACGLDSMAEGTTNWACMNPDGSTKELLHVNRRLHPFKFLPTCEMFWRLSRLEHRQQDRESYKDVNDPVNTIAIKYRVSKILNTGVVVSVRQRLVACRYVQANSFVLVWKLFVEGEGFFHGMHSNESGWCRLRPSTSQAGTLMEVHVRRMPLHYRAALSRGQAAHHFDGLMKESTNEDQQKVMQGLQRLILDDTLDGANSNSSKM
ncbi:Hypothetical protein PHPALM_6699 [Phytophthora palmivora]|uniref:M96 mating-specific protein family n=1 Tax=Phytophthora palmivora TaxID=4796 RepID=A0A2P4YE73_9STRA|nr:Hypothetical protein PHPALM_6699 [Phytophthora palmivora]